MVGRVFPFPGTQGWDPSAALVCDFFNRGRTIFPSRHHRVRPRWSSGRAYRSEFSHHCGTAFVALVASFPKNGSVIRHALFDWDGTLSLLRAGWGEVMQAQWLVEIPRVTGETDADRERFAHDEIWSLNGKPTIHQMARLAELVATRGGPARTAVEYNADYQARLAAMVDERIAQIRSGTATPDDFMVAGARDFLTALARRGVVLYLASGTEYRFITAEAERLGLAHFFGQRFHGPRDPDDRVFSKRGVMDQILLDTQLPGAALVAFGDGHVEIEQARAVGGYAVAVCSDEESWRSRRLDAAKQSRLTTAGAHFCIPDFTEPAEWMDRLPWAL